MSRHSSRLNWLHAAQKETAAHQDHFQVQRCQNLHQVQPRVPNSTTYTLYHCILFQLIVSSFCLHFVNYHFPFYFKLLWNKGMFQTVSLLDTKLTSLAVSLKSTFGNDTSGLHLKVYINLGLKFSFTLIRSQQLFLLIIFRTIQYHVGLKLNYKDL